MGLYDSLKEAACNANLELREHGLVIHTFGNVSVVDRHAGVFAIKPSGVPYSHLRPDEMVVLDLDGRIVEGRMRPSSDTASHAVLYRELPEVVSVVHTHSPYAVAWAQAQRAIPVLGTTHADQFPGPIPCTPLLEDAFIRGDYEEETGKLICRTLRTLEGPRPEMILVAGHGPFTWGCSPTQAVLNSLLLEEVARMALLTFQINAEALSLKATLIQKHFERKHGPKATYGQPGAAQELA